MKLTTEELEEIHWVIYDKVHYGDDDIVYGDTPEVNALRSALGKIDDELELRRKLDDQS